MMPIQHARVNVLYALIIGNVMMFIVLLLTIAYVNQLGGRVTNSDRKACVRGNVLREAARYLLLEPGLRSAASVRIAAKPELADQPCEILYP